MAVPEADAPRLGIDFDFISGRVLSSNAGRTSHPGERKIDSREKWIRLSLRWSIDEKDENEERHTAKYAAGLGSARNIDLLQVDDVLRLRGFRWVTKCHPGILIMWTLKFAVNYDCKSSSPSSSKGSPARPRACDQTTMDLETFVTNLTPDFAIIVRVFKYCCFWIQSSWIHGGGVGYIFAACGDIDVEMAAKEAVIYEQALVNRGVWAYMDI